MPNGYTLFASLNPAGGLYRFKPTCPWTARVGDHFPWKGGKAYLLIKWERPEGIDKKSSLLNAFFFVDGQEKCVDISFFKHLEQIG